MGTEVEPTTLRACDGCTACCYTHAVDELDKYEFNDCIHCDKGVGCAIYASKPRSCSVFQCLWLSGDVGEDTVRPDKLGIVCSPIYTRFTRNDPPMIFLFEARDGALEEPSGKEFLMRLLRKGNTLRVGTRDGEPRYSYHLLQVAEMEAFGKMLEEKMYRVVWHTP